MGVGDWIGGCVLRELCGLGGEGIVVAVEMGWIRSCCLGAHLSCPLFRIQLKSVI